MQETKQYEITEEARKNFAKLFKEARQARNLRQKDVAEEVGISQNYVSSLEKGPTRETSIIGTLRLAGYYGITPSVVAETLGLFDTKGAEGIPDHLFHTIELLKQVPRENLDTINTVIKHFIDGPKKPY